jgi:hypothetical protein
VFTGFDPFEGFIVLPESLNRYGYVSGNPSTHVDPSGLQGGFENIFRRYGGGMAAAGGGIALGIALAQALREFGGEIVEGIKIDELLDLPHYAWRPEEESEPESAPTLPPLPFTFRVTVTPETTITSAVTATSTATATPTPTCTPTLTSTPTSTPEPQKPIVLDLGPGLSVLEVYNLIAHYRGRARVIAIDSVKGYVDNLRFDFAANIPNDLEVLWDTYSKPNILKKRGYDCAIAAFSINPGLVGHRYVATAVENLVCAGGTIYVVSDIRERFESIKQGLEGLVNFTFTSPPTIPRDCIENPHNENCASDYGEFGPGIGFPPYARLSYVIWAVKR